MVETLLHIDGIACRSCGAVRAPHHVYRRDGICDNCWSKFLYARERFKTKGLIEDDFNKWLARQVFLNLTRLENFGVTGRCEAVSDWRYGNRGYQCGLPATMLRDDHRVCAKHHAQHKINYVDGTLTGDPYVAMEGIIRRLCEVDARFRAAVTNALAPKESNSLIGARFGRLVVVRHTDERRKGNREFIVECKCDCGKTTMQPVSCLRQGNSLSCGCYRKERSQSRAKAAKRNAKGLWQSEDGVVFSLPPVEL